MKDFIREVEIRHMYFRKSLKFYSENHFLNFLKVLTFLIFIWPTLALSLLLFVLSAVNVFIGVIPLINFVYGTICGFFGVIVDLMYRLVNLPEAKEFGAEAGYLADQYRKSI